MFCKEEKQEEKLRGASRGKPEAGRKNLPLKIRNVEFFIPSHFYTKSNKGKESGEMKKKLTYHNFYFYLLLLSPILVVYILFLRCR